MIKRLPTLFWMVIFSFSSLAQRLQTTVGTSAPKEKWAVVQDPAINAFVSVGTVTVNGMQNVWISSYNQNGTVLTTARANAGRNIVARDISIAPPDPNTGQPTYYVTGWTEWPVGGVPVSQIFIGRMYLNGAFMWYVENPIAGQGNPKEGVAIATEPNTGDCVALGNVQWPPPAPGAPPAPAGPMIILTRVTPVGGILWSNVFVQPGIWMAREINIGVPSPMCLPPAPGFGEFVITGEVQGVVPNTLSSTFVAAYNGMGVECWRNVYPAVTTFPLAGDAGYDVQYDATSASYCVAGVAQTNNLRQGPGSTPYFLSIAPNGVLNAGAVYTAGGNQPMGFYPRSIALGQTPGQIVCSGPDFGNNQMFSGSLPNIPGLPAGGLFPPANFSTYIGQATANSVAQPFILTDGPTEQIVLNNGGTVAGYFSSTSSLPGGAFGAGDGHFIKTNLMLQTPNNCGFTPISSTPNQGGIMVASTSMPTMLLGWDTSQHPISAPHIVQQVFCRDTCSVGVAVVNLTCTQPMGQASANPILGSPPYAYMWNTGQTTASIQPAPPGFYSVSMGDGNGCIAYGSGQVQAIAPPTLSISSTNTSCSGNTGTATVSTTGGTPPFTYLWSNGATTATATGLGAGTWSVTVTDSLTCVVGAAVNITRTPVIVANMSSTPSNCTGSTGTATASGGNGTAPYSYLWDNGATTSTISNLAAGMYTVTVTDSNGCTATGSVVVSLYSAPEVVASSTHASCGLANGTASASVSGGTVPYSYVWSTAETTSSIQNLGTGTYSVTITDANGCTVVSNTVTVEAIPSPSVSFAVTHTSCGLNNGAISTTVYGGTAPYTYSWSNGATSSDIHNLNAKVYTLTITDANQCIVSQGATVDSSSAPVPAIATTHTSCGVANGAASAAVSGGIAPYSYVWSTGETSASLSDKTPGTYSLTVTDATGCTGTGSTTVNPSSAPEVSVSSTATTCGLPNGTATSSASGGVGPYSYSWSNGSAGTSIAGLAAGNYSVTVLDAAGCGGFGSFNVGGSAALSISTSFSNAVCSANNGSITATVSAGSPPYAYLWNNGATTATINNLAPGSYSVVATDAIGCTATGLRTIGISGQVPVVPTFTLTQAYVCRSKTAIFSVQARTGETYTWTPSTGATISSGQGTSSVVVSFASNAVSAVLNVKSQTTSCGFSPNATFSYIVVTAKPGTPGVIQTGPAGQYPCANSTNVLFACPATLYANTHTWTVPAGATVVSGQGTNIITVNFGALTVGTVSVVASNCIGTSAARSYTVYGTPATPATLAGPVVAVCAGSTGKAYSCSAVTGATGYTWTAPANANVASGQGTTAITANFNTGFTAGVLSVTANNACGSSAAKTVTIQSVPAVPGAITGPALVCANSTNKTYSVVAITNATSYLWAIPSGTITTGQGTRTVKVNFGATAGNVTVKSGNACGYSTAQALAVGFNCRIAVDKPLFAFDLYPNPVQSEVTLRFTAEADGAYDVRFTDQTGREVLRAQSQAFTGENQASLEVEKLPAGIYFVTFELAGHRVVRKLVVQ